MPVRKEEACYVTKTKKAKKPQMVRIEMAVTFTIEGERKHAEDAAENFRARARHYVVGESYHSAWPIKSSSVIATVRKSQEGRKP
jgi:hypothetical protein